MPIPESLRRCGPQDGRWAGKMVRHHAGIDALIWPDSYEVGIYVRGGGLNEPRQRINLNGGELWLLDPEGNWLLPQKGEVLVLAPVAEAILQWAAAVGGRTTPVPQFVASVAA